MCSDLENARRKELPLRALLARLALTGCAMLAGLFIAEGLLYALKTDPGLTGPGKKASGAKRLVFIGDSLLVSTMKGMKEEDLLIDRLDTILPGWEVVNLAKSGEGPVYYRDIWERQGRRCGADAVLTFLYLGNDMKDVWGEARRVGFDLAAVETMLASQRTEWRPSLPRRLAQKQFPRLYQLLKRTAKSKDIKSDVAEPDTLSKMALQHAIATDRAVNTNTLESIPEEYLTSWHKGELNPWMLATAAVAPEYHRECVDPTTDEHVKSFDLGLQLIRSIREDCRELKIPHYLVVIPSAMQLVREAGEHHQRIGYDTKGIFGNTNAQLRVAAFCRANDIPCLDLTPILRPAAADAYYVVDGHWKSAGHRIAAEAVFRRLSADGVFP